jgi:hypothetical protein
MPQELKLIIKGLKPYQDKHTGEDIEPISGLPIFPEKTQMSDVSHFHNKKAYLYTEEEHLIKQAEIPNLEEYLLNMMEYVKTALLNQQDFETELNKVLEYIRESQQKEG